MGPPGAIIIAFAGLSQATALDGPTLSPTGITASEAAMDNACRLFNQLPRATPAPEKEAIRLTGRARIEGSRLNVGRWTVPHNVGGDVDDGHNYVGRYAGLPIDVAITFTYDSVGWTVFDQEARLKRDVPSLPIPSPDLRRLLIVDPYEGPAGAVSIYRREPLRWVREARFKVDLPCNVQWGDDHTVLVWRLDTRGGKLRPLQAEVVSSGAIRLSGGRWKHLPPRETP